MNITNIPAPRVDLIDERTGLISTEWYRFFINLFVLTGSGQSDISVTDLAINPVGQDVLSAAPNLGPDTQIASIMARWDEAQAAIQGAYLNPPKWEDQSLLQGAYLSPPPQQIQSSQLLPVAGAAGVILRSNGTLFVNSTDTWPDTVAAGDLLRGGSANTVTALTIGATGKILQSNGTQPVWSTATFPTAATLNKVLAGDGTNIVLSTPTIPLNASPGANKVVVGDGSNFVLSTPTVPLTSSPSAGKVMVGDGTNWVASTPTYPNAAPAAGTFPRGDGTNFVTSTLTIPNAAAVGDLAYASASNVLSMLADVATGNALISGGVTTAPSYGKIGLTTHITGTLAADNGGTGVANNAAATLTRSGNHSLTLTTSNTTSLTLPTSGTVTALGNTTTGSGSIVLSTLPTFTTGINLNASPAPAGVIRLGDADKICWLTSGTDYVALRSSTGTVDFAGGTVFPTNYSFRNASGAILASSGAAWSFTGALTFASLGGGGGAVTVGAADSGGVGFKLLRVPN